MFKPFDSGPLPDRQSKAIVVAIIMNSNGLNGVLGSSSAIVGKNVDSRCFYPPYGPCKGHFPSVGNPPIS